MEPDKELDPPIAQFRATVVARMEAAKAEVDRYIRFLKIFDEFAKVESPPAPRGRGRPSHGAATAATEEVVVPLLRALGPQSTTQLLRIMKQHGFDIGGSAPRATLHSRLGRSELVESVPGIGWRLKGEPDLDAAAKEDIA